MKGDLPQLSFAIAVLRRQGVGYLRPAEVLLPDIVRGRLACGRADHRIFENIKGVGILRAMSDESRCLGIVRTKRPRDKRQRELRLRRLAPDRIDRLGDDLILSGPREINRMVRVIRHRVGIGLLRPAQQLIALAGHAHGNSKMVVHQSGGAGQRSHIAAALAVKAQGEVRLPDRIEGFNDSLGHGDLGLQARQGAVLRRAVRGLGPAAELISLIGWGSLPTQIEGVPVLAAVYRHIRHRAAAPAVKAERTVAPHRVERCVLDPVVFPREREDISGCILRRRGVRIRRPAEEHTVGFCRNIAGNPVHGRIYLVAVGRRHHPRRGRIITTIFRIGVVTAVAVIGKAQCLIVRCRDRLLYRLSRLSRQRDLCHTRISSPARKAFVV